MSEKDIGAGSWWELMVERARPGQAGVGCFS